MQPGLFFQVTHADFCVSSEILYQAGKAAPRAPPDPPQGPPVPYVWEHVTSQHDKQDFLPYFGPLRHGKNQLLFLFKQAAVAISCPAR